MIAIEVVMIKGKLTIEIKIDSNISKVIVEVVVDQKEWQAIITEGMKEE